MASPDSSPSTPPFAACVKRTRRVSSPFQSLAPSPWWPSRSARLCFALLPIATTAPFPAPPWTHVFGFQFFAFSNWWK
jgi:hypothetical protein